MSPPPCDIPSGCVVSLRGPGQFFPSHVASGRCFLSAAGYPPPPPEGFLFSPAQAPPAHAPHAMLRCAAGAAPKCKLNPLDRSRGPATPAAPGDGAVRAHRPHGGGGGEVVRATTTGHGLGRRERGGGGGSSEVLNPEKRPHRRPTNGGWRSTDTLRPVTAGGYRRVDGRRRHRASPPRPPPQRPSFSGRVGGGTHLRPRARVPRAAGALPVLHRAPPPPPKHRHPQPQPRRPGGVGGTAPASAPGAAPASSPSGTSSASGASASASAPASSSGASSPSPARGLCGSVFPLRLGGLAGLRLAAGFPAGFLRERHATDGAAAPAEGGGRVARGRGVGVGVGAGEPKPVWLWRRLLAPRHCSFGPSVGPNVFWLCQRSPRMTCPV